MCIKLDPISHSQYHSRWTGVIQRALLVDLISRQGRIIERCYLLLYLTYLLCNSLETKLIIRMQAIFTCADRKLHWNSNLIVWRLSARTLHFISLVVTFYIWLSGWTGDLPFLRYFKKQSHKLISGNLAFCRLVEEGTSSFLERPSPVNCQRNYARSFSKMLRIIFRENVSFKLIVGQV